MLSDAPSVAAQKPRSMRAGARNVLRSNDSASLWNCTLSPGWTQEESEILRKLLIKFGVGNWAKIIESECLPGKTNAQMNLQMQRLLGQQSTAEFAGLHIDPKVVGEKNSKIQGPHVKRKNNTIVNTGTKLSREALRERVAKNKIKYELPKEVWSSITLADVRSQLTIDELLADDRDEPMSDASPHTNGNGHTSDAADSPANQAQDNHDDDMDDDDPEAWIDDDGPMPKKVQVTVKKKIKK
ncbi:hypothetical protein BC940DRAFT_241116 [Gongronella butleri]|nr:hypothetical protein BC940DRAFT_241116 [Gongronella butleri]